MHLAVLSQRKASTRKWASCWRRASARRRAPATTSPRSADRPKPAATRRRRSRRVCGDGWRPARERRVRTARPSTRSASSRLAQAYQAVSDGRHQLDRRLRIARELALDARLCGGEQCRRRWSPRRHPRRCSLPRRSTGRSPSPARRGRRGAGSFGLLAGGARLPQGLLPRPRQGPRARQLAPQPLPARRRGSPRRLAASSLWRRTQRSA